jgi:hypothetical protein
MHKISNYIRVTDVLYPFSNLSHIDPSILKNAAHRGTKVHEVCSAIMENLGVLELDDSVAGYITSFEKWAQGKKGLKRPDRF